MWIEEYRERNGLELDEFARRVNIVGRKMKPPLVGTVSDSLIYYLERGIYKKTHPMIADAIAMVCGATKEQRNMIVDEKHWETWCATRDPFSWKEEIPVRQNQNDLDYSIVMVDENGKILHRYGSARIASRYGEMTPDSIRTRCLRKIKYEFSAYPYTYRYAREWDKMNREEKLRDLGVEMSEGGGRNGVYEEAEDNGQGPNEQRAERSR